MIVHSKCLCIPIKSIHDTVIIHNIQNNVFNFKSISNFCGDSDRFKEVVQDNVFKVLMINK